MDEIYPFIAKNLSNFKNLEIKEVIKEDFLDKVIDVEYKINEFLNDLELIDEILSSKFVDIEEIVSEHYGKLFKIPYNYSFKVELDKDNNDFLINVYYPRFNKEELNNFKYKLEIAKIIAFLYLYTDIFIGTETIRNEDYLEFEKISNNELREKYEEMKANESLIDFALILLLPRFLIKSLTINMEEASLVEKADIIKKELNIESSLILRRLYLNKTFKYANKTTKKS